MCAIVVSACLLLLLLLLLFCARFALVRAPSCQICAASYFKGQKDLKKEARLKCKFNLLEARINYTPR